MSDAKHTPGPWGFDEVDGEIFYADGDVRPMIGSVSCENCQTHGQYLADGHLIAAAPDLLAALKAVLAAGPLKYTGKRCQDARELARAAIAKAEGREP